MRTPFLPVLAALTSTLVATAACAGVYFESTDKNLVTAAKPVTSKMWFDGGRMRSERAHDDEDGNLTIFKNRAMYTIDTSSKTYRVIDKATVDKMGAQFAEAKKKMAAQMASMPPEQRAMMEKMMGQMGGGAPGAAAAPTRTRTLKNTGRTETVAGIKCSVWEAAVNGQKEEELCAAEPGSIPGGDEAMKTFREIGAMLKGFTESFGARGKKSTAPWNDLETINGVPILTRDFEHGKATSETRLMVARKESVPDSAFEVPAGYTEKKISIGPGSDED